MEVCDAGVPESDEVLDGEDGPTLVVGVDRGVPLGSGVRVDGDDGIEVLDIALVGVTTIAPSMSVPESRESERRSQPGRSTPVRSPA